MAILDIKRDRRVIALDFDGVLSIITPLYPAVYKMSPLHTQLVRYLQSRGFQVVISTARPEEYLSDVREACKEVGIFCSIETKKVDADILIDDTAGNINIVSVIQRIHNLYPDVTMEGYLSSFNANTFCRITEREPYPRGDVIAWSKVDSEGSLIKLIVPFHDQSLVYYLEGIHPNELVSLVPEIDGAYWKDGVFGIYTTKGTNVAEELYLCHVGWDKEPFLLSNSNMIEPPTTVFSANQDGIRVNKPPALPIYFKYEELLPEEEFLVRY